MQKNCSAMLLLLLAFLMSGTTLNAAQVNKVAAIVNGQLITMFDLQKNAAYELARAKVNPADPAKKEAANKILRNVLDNMILDILVAQEAARLKVSVADSEVNAEILRMQKANKRNAKQMEQELAAIGKTVASFKEEIRKNLLRQKVMSMEIGRKVVVTPEEINEYYEKHKDSMIDRTGWHMGLLVYSPKVNAESIAQQIKTGKITFEEACAKYSVAPNRDKSGDQGPIEWDKLNPEWDKRLNQMRPGDVTNIFPLQGFKAQVAVFKPGGWNEKKLTLQEAAPQIDAVLRAPKAKSRFEDYSKKLREKAVIDIRM